MTWLTALLRPSGSCCVAGVFDGEELPLWLLWQAASVSAASTATAADAILRRIEVPSLNMAPALRHPWLRCVRHIAADDAQDA